MTAARDGVDVRVDHDLCLSSQSCVRAQPLAFAIGDDGLAMVLPSVDQVGLDDLIAASRECPVHAIEIWHDGRPLVNGD